MHTDPDPVEILRARRRVPSVAEMLAAIAERDARREVLAIAERLATAAGDAAVESDVADHLATRAAAPRCGDTVYGRQRTCCASCSGCGGHDVLRAHDRPSGRDVFVYETAARDEYAFVCSLPLASAIARLAEANRAEQWPMPLNALLLKICAAATPEQRLAVVRRSTAAAVEAQTRRWPTLAIEDTPCSWWLASAPTVTSIRSRLLEWAAGGNEDIGRLLADAFSMLTTVVVRCMPDHRSCRYPAYCKAARANNRVAAYEAAGAPDAAAAVAAYDIANIAAGSTSADEPLVRYLADRGGCFEADPIRGSLDHEAHLAAERGARYAAKAAASVGISATDAASRAEADWAQLQYICGLLDGRGEWDSAGAQS